MLIVHREIIAVLVGRRTFWSNVVHLYMTSKARLMLLLIAVIALL